MEGVPALLVLEHYLRLMSPQLLGQQQHAIEINTIISVYELLIGFFIDMSRHFFGTCRGAFGYMITRAFPLPDQDQHRPPAS